MRLGLLIAIYSALDWLGVELHPALMIAYSIGMLMAGMQDGNEIRKNGG